MPARSGVSSGAEAHRVLPGGRLAEPRGLLRPPGVGGEDAEGAALPRLRGLAQVQEDDRGGGHGWHPTRVRTYKHQLRMFPQEII